MSRNRALDSCAAALLCSLVASPAFGQFETSAVLGSIFDPNGATVQNARVTITNLEHGVVQKAISDSTGGYQFLEVRLGRYKLAAEAEGFKRAESAAFHVDAGARQRVDMRLELGDVSQKVDVTRPRLCCPPIPASAVKLSTRRRLWTFL